MTIETKQNLEGIMEVREFYDCKPVNKLLKEGNWKLLEMRSEKLTKTETESSISLLLGGLLYTNTEVVPIVNEELRTKYVIGKYKEVNKK